MAAAAAEPGIQSAEAPAAGVEAAVAVVAGTAAGTGEESTALAGRSMSGTAAAAGPVPGSPYTAAAVAAATAGSRLAELATDIQCIAAAMAVAAVAVRSPWAAAQRGLAAGPAAGQARDCQRSRHTAAAVASPGEGCCRCSRRRSSWNTSRGCCCLEPDARMSGLILRRFKRSKEERESSAARRDADKGENSERTNE